MGFFSELRGRFNRPWWVNFHRDDWYEWARIEPGGRVKIYDMHGDLVRGTDYGSKRKAVDALERMGYHRYGRKDQARATPPGDAT